MLVKPKAGISPESLANLHAQFGTRALHTFAGIGNLQILRVPSGAVAANLAERYRKTGQVEYAEPDALVHVLSLPDDFRFQDGSQWNLLNIGQLGGTSDADIDAPEAWDTLTSASNVIVAVTDTGVRLTHEDLQPNLWTNPGEIPGNGLDDDGDGYVDDLHGMNTLLNNGNPEDDHGHGTHLSGIIGARGSNSVGVAGVCWRVQLMACKFINTNGDGTISDAIKCIDYARIKGAKVISASWGDATFNSQALRDAITSARNADIIIVAACGNTHDDTDLSPRYPASFDLDNIIAVAATTRTDELASFSSYGATSVDIAAPGSPVYSCWNSADDAYQYHDGTSLAAAHVAGACALTRALYPTETYRQIIQRILNAADPLPTLAGKCVTGGRLNLQKALAGATPAFPTLTVAASDSGASEGGDTGTFSILRNGSTTSPLTVYFALSGTASNGADYAPLANSVTLPAGAASAPVTVTPIKDPELEGNETVVLRLTGNVAYAVGSPNNAMITIADNAMVNALVIQGLSLDGPDAATITWSSEMGRSYQVKFKDDLGATDWPGSSSIITATNTTTSWTDTTRSATLQRYYFVQQVE